eukprot:Platyproteum_vivax@DN7093_c0_g1_i2.p1
MVRKIMQQIDTEKQKMEKASEGDLDGFQRATKSMAAMITLVKLLGEGGTASVYKCELSGEGVKPVALKVMKNSRCEDCAHAVHKYMQHVHHPNICGVRRVRKTKYGTCVEMELMRGPQIMAWKDSPKHKFNISTAQHIMKDLLSALKELHLRHRLAHGDLKLDNCHFKAPLRGHGDPFQVAIMDFDAAILICDERQLVRNTYCGTLEYKSPEALLGYAGAPVDMWAAGVCLHVLMDGCFPFKIRKAWQDGFGEDVFEALLKGPQFCLPIWLACPEA